MGSIEITKTHPTIAEAVILDAVQREKICPLTGYVAKNPEEEFSPYASQGVNKDKVVRLIDAGIEEKPGMEPLDPIVEGDFVTNPFYSRERDLRFVIAGEPVSYSAREIRQKIEKYGGIVQDEVGVDTDYLVLGLVPEESAVVHNEEALARYKRAVKARDTAQQYGIPIMREVELFDFLR
jgi:NAD-dependent DNA ligase